MQKDYTRPCTHGYCRHHRAQLVLCVYHLATVARIILTNIYMVVWAITALSCYVGGFPWGNILATSMILTICVPHLLDTPYHCDDSDQMSPKILYLYE